MCFYHAGCTPDIGWCAVTGSYQHLKRTILPGLDVICEVFMLQEEEEKQKHAAPELVVSQLCVNDFFK